MPLLYDVIFDFSLSEKSCFVSLYLCLINHSSPSSSSSSSGIRALVDLSLFLNFISFSTEHFLWGGVVSPTPNPQAGGPGYPFLFGFSPLTCLAWEALPVATLPPA
jgi:hypothetical protein